jgi:hypothetical protein
MALRVKHKVNVRIWESTSEKDVLFAPDDTLAEVSIDTWVRQNSGKVSVAVSDNEDLPLGDVTAVKGIYLKLDGEAQVKLNGSADAIQLRKGGSASYAKLFIECDISAVNIINPSADDVLNGTYCVWGDLT